MLTIAKLAVMKAVPVVREFCYWQYIVLSLAFTVFGTRDAATTASIPAERVGVYMGIFNMFIVIPMIIQIFTLPLYYDSLLGGNPSMVIRLAGGLLLCAAVATLFVKVTAPIDAVGKIAPRGH